MEFAGRGAGDGGAGEGEGEGGEEPRSDELSQEKRQCTPNLILEFLTGRGQGGGKDDGGQGRGDGSADDRGEERRSAEHTGEEGKSFESDTAISHLFSRGILSTQISDDQQIEPSTSLIGLFQRLSGYRKKLSYIPYIFFFVYSTSNARRSTTTLAETVESGPPHSVREAARQSGQRASKTKGVI